MKTKTMPKPRQTPGNDIITELRTELGLLRRAHLNLIRGLADRVTVLETDNRTLLEVVALNVFMEEAKAKRNQDTDKEDEYLSDDEAILFFVQLRSMLRNRGRLQTVVEEMKSRTR